MKNTLKNMRRKFLEEGRFVKYLYYATGEIFIVVTGIIVALYLNDWNQERKDKSLERHYYQSIRVQLTEDLNTLNDVMEYDRQHYNQFVYEKQLMRKGGRRNTDTLGKIAVNMIRYADFRRKSNVYQTLVSSGEIAIIRDNGIKENLQALEENYQYVNRLEENHSTIIFSQLIPDLQKVMQFDPLKIADTATFFSYSFQNYFTLLMTLMEEKRSAYQQAKDKITATLKLTEDQEK